MISQFPMLRRHCSRQNSSMASMSPTPSVHDMQNPLTLTRGRFVHVMGLLLWLCCIILQKGFVHTIKIIWSNHFVSNKKEIILISSDHIRGDFKRRQRHSVYLQGAKWKLCCGECYLAGKAMWALGAENSKQTACK